MIKKVLLSAFVAFSLLFPVMSVAPAHAIDILNPPGSANGPCNNGNATSKPEICGDNRTSGKNPFLGKDGIITSVIYILSIVIGITSVIIIVVEGIRMIAGAGDPGTVSTARRGVVYAVVGLLVAVLSQAIVAFVLNKFS